MNQQNNHPHADEAGAQKLSLYSISADATSANIVVLADTHTENLIRPLQSTGLFLMLF